MAGLGRKIFTAGDVLTASDTMNYLMDQTIMNFAGTAARSSAIATPTQGMVSYRDDIDNLELYNGSAWVSASGLQLVKKQTIGSAVSSVNVTGAFSATYENYKIILSGGAGTTAQVLYLHLGTTGSDHYAAQMLVTYTTAASSFTTDNAANFWTRAGYGNTNGLNMNVELGSPFLAKNTTYSASFIPNATLSNAGFSTGFRNNTTSYTDFTITTSSGTMTGGTIYVYGYGQ